MKQSWRWYGPKDPTTLRNVRQAGATGVVTALHHIYDGRGWSVDDVLAHKALVEREGLEWVVCESIPVLTDIKIRGDGYRAAIDNWITSLRSLAAADIKVVCFNFMPVVDWTRTELRHPMPSTGLALRFDMTDLVAYDVFHLRRPRADADYPAALVAAAEARYAQQSADQRDRVEANVIRGLPGSEGSYDRAEFLRQLARYDGIGAEDLRSNLIDFIREVAPIAEELGVGLAIHPDDPPVPLFGLPRVVSTASDLAALFAAVPSPANGMTLCAGSYGSRPDNDVLGIADRFAERIHFVHLRNVSKEPDGSFNESDHLGGDVDFVALIASLLNEERRRRAAGGYGPHDLPFRPDHGHLLLDDIEKPNAYPGYSAVGRLRGLAELRGIITTLEHARFGLPGAIRD